MNHTILAVLLDCGDTLVDEASEVKDENGVTQRAELIPGAAEMLNALQKQGYRLGLVADGPEGTFRNIFRQHGLEKVFEAEAISELVGCSKPDRRMFLHALNQLGIQPQDYNRVVMVGNYLARDIKGANDLGLISVWLDWSPRRPKIPADPSEAPRFTIKNPLELLDVLADCEKAAGQDHSA